ncbi:MAG: Gfo/Idh/MocA family oxidoreductase [Candidatus Brocadiia bacterium]
MPESRTSRPRPAMGVGVLGFGFMGKTHTLAHKSIPFYYDPAPARVTLRAVCTSRHETAVRAREVGGFARWTLDPLEVIQADDVDIVHICTPNSEHFPALEAAVAAGKHIYVDKPVTGSLEEADRLEDMLQDYGGTAQVALQYRFYPATIRAKQLVEEGRIGPVTHFRAVYLHSGSVDPGKAVNWKSTAAAGGGVIRDLGSHVLDLLGWLIGPFEAVHCQSRIWADERPDSDHPGETMEVDAEEAAVMLLRCPDGAFGSVEASKIATGTEDELRFEIHGRQGAMRFNLMQPNYLEYYDEREPAGECGGSRGWKRIAAVQKYPGTGADFPGPKFSIGWIRGHFHSLYCFLKAAAEGTEPSPSLAQGLHLQRVLEAVRTSARRGEWTDLPQPDEG